MRGLKIFVIMLALVMLCACGKTPGAAGSDNGTETKNNEPAETIETGELIELSYYPGYSDMDGGYHGETLKKDDSGEWIVECYDKESIDEPEITTIYSVNAMEEQDFATFLKENNVASLMNCKDSDVFATDYSPWSFSVIFTNPSPENGKRVFVSFGQYKEYTDEESELIKELRERFEALKGEVISKSVESEEEDPDDIEETDEESSDIDEVGEPYCGVLYWYKQLQESGKSWDEMEKYNSQTALVQHGWPYSTNNDEVRYVYQDITGDGLIELIITYYGDPVDIYSNDGDAVYAYGVPYRAIAEIYPDGTIMEGLTMGTKGWNETWYRYDEDTFKYVPLKEKLSPGTSGVTFPEGKRISDVVVPDGLDLID